MKYTLALFLTACQMLAVPGLCRDYDNIEDILHSAGAYIGERPDSALALLDMIPREKLRGRKPEAEFALLYSMALDKNCIYETDDSLINIAVKWYRRHGSADDCLKAYYYQGRIYQNAGDNERAIESFFMAERYIEKSVDNIQKGLLFNAKAAIYESLFQFRESIGNARTAAEYYLAAKDTSRYINTMLFICSNHISDNDFIGAENRLASIRDFVPAMSDIQKSDYYTAQLHTAIYNDSGIEQVISEYIREVDDKSYINWIALAYGYLSIRDYDSGFDAISRYRETDPEYHENPAYLLVASELNELTGRYEEALLSYKQYVNSSDNTDMDIFDSNAKFVEEKMLSRYRLQNRNLWIAILILGIILLITSGLLLCAELQEKIRRKQQEKERLEQEKHEIETEMESYRKLYEQARAEKKNLLRIKQDQKLDKEIRESIEERLDVLNRFITAAISKNLISSATDALDDYLRDKERFIYSTRLSFIIMHPKFISYLKKSGLTENEIGYCCLYCIGMNGNEIASYLKRKSFYNTSSTIRKKLGLEEYKTNLDIFLRGKMTELD